jgi:hypothetical protein
LLELSQRGPGLETELVHEPGARGPVGVERLGLTAAAIEGEHQQFLRTLAQRIGRRQALQLGDGLPVTAAGEVGLDAPLEGHEAKLVEAQASGAEDIALRDVGQGFTAPERQCSTERGRSFLGTAVVERARTLRREPLEARQVDHIALHPQHVAGIAGLHRVAAESLTQLRDVSLEDVGGSLGRRVGPDGVDQPRDGHDLSGMEREYGEDGARTRAEAHRSAVGECLHRAQQTELERHAATLTAGRPHRRRPPASVQRSRSGGGDPRMKRCGTRPRHQGGEHRCKLRGGLQSSRSSLPQSSALPPQWRLQARMVRSSSGAPRSSSTRTSGSRTDGSLIGTWQTTSFKTIAEGLTQTAGVSGAPYEYAAAGTELFTGCHDRNANKRCEAAEKGTLKFTFTYWGTFDPESGALIKAQCQHPVVGGTGAFKQARGVVYMNDRPTASGVVTVYSGTLAYGSAVGRSLSSVGAAKGCGRSS